MQQTIQTYGTRSSTTEGVLMIPRVVYAALHPMDQLAAQALERIGKVRIIDENER